MDSTTTWTTETIPSCIGMPVSGDVRLVARDKAAAVAYLTGAFPGTRAWRPPVC